MPPLTYSRNIDRITDKIVMRRFCGSSLKRWQFKKKRKGVIVYIWTLKIEKSAFNRKKL
jgi:hypothetical protein